MEINSEVGSIFFDFWMQKLSSHQIVIMGNARNFSGTCDVVSVSSDVGQLSGWY